MKNYILSGAILALSIAALKFAVAIPELIGVYQREGWGATSVWDVLHVAGILFGVACGLALLGGLIGAAIGWAMLRRPRARAKSRTDLTSRR